MHPQRVRSVERMHLQGLQGANERQDNKFVRVSDESNHLVITRVSCPPLCLASSAAESVTSRFLPQDEHCAFPSRY